MHRIICIFFLIFAIPQSSISQVTPKEDSKLNYRLVGFSFPSKKGVRSYSIEIAKGTYTVEDSFKKHIIKDVQSSIGKIVTEVPSFGSDYTWRVLYTGKKPDETTRVLYHFSTLSIPEIDSNLYRLNVTTEAKTYKEAYVFVDATRTMYDMKGQPVWFLPLIDSEMHHISPRDMKLSPGGTITFLLKENIYEVNYNGDILWKGPRTGIVSGDSLEYFHHEFTRLKNGHYMVMGSESALIKLPSFSDSSMHFLTKDKVYKESKTATFQSTVLGPVLEYDASGNLVWSWKSSKYFDGTDIDYITTNPFGGKGLNADVHENAFYFDEKTNNIYISFKNLNRIIKVKYPEGKVVNEYGENYKRNEKKKTDKLFCGQHSCGVSQKGYLYTFNNNDCNPLSGAKIVMLQEPVPGKRKLRKIWEYEFPMGNYGVNKQINFRQTSGGNVIELPDQSLFAALYATDGRMFIINTDKEILWEAKSERMFPGLGKWEANTASYRASIICNRKNLEHLVWGEEITDN